MKLCIASIQEQTFTNYEVWIIDGNSKDGTKIFLKTLPSHFYNISEADGGIYDAMNKGILQSKGKWLYFMGADDTLSSKYVLDKVVSKLNSGANLLLGKIQYRSDATMESRTLKAKMSKFLWVKNTMHHQAVFYEASLFKGKGYDTSYKVLADYKLNLQLFQEKVSVAQVNEVITICGADGISKKFNWGLYREDIRLKTELTSILLRPLFYIVATTKFVLKKISI